MSPLSRLIRVVVISIIDPPLGESVRVAQNVRAGLRGYVHFNKYTHTHTNTHTQTRVVDATWKTGETWVEQGKKIENKGLVQ